MATEWYLCCEYFSWIAVCSRPTRLAFRWKLCSAPAHSLNSLALQHMQYMVGPCYRTLKCLSDNTWKDKHYRSLWSTEAIPHHI